MYFKFSFYKKRNIKCVKQGKIQFQFHDAKQNGESSRVCSLPKQTKIVIVGAGAAGIAAASRLLQKGVNDFVILEANDRIGGRINSKDFGENVVDLGAEWVHGESGNVVFQLASKHNLLNSSAFLLNVSKYEVVTINGEIMPNEESTKALTLYFNIMDKMDKEELENETGSLGDYFIRKYYKAFDEKPFMNRTRVAEYLSLIEKMQNSADCSDTWFDVSVKLFIDYWECEGDLTLNWKGRGYKTIFDVLLQKIPNSEERLPVMEKIEFEKVVATINYSSGENVTVTTRDGCEYFASHVIFTGSLGVLKEKHSSMFVPPLPQKKQRAIEGLNIGTANKIFLEFPHRWWPEDKTTFNFIWSEKDKKEFLQTHGQNSEWLCDVFMFVTVAYQPNLLCAWITGKNARYIETLSDTDVFDGLYLLLKEAFESHDNVTKPTRILRSKWYTNEHFRGSYSFHSMLSEQMNVTSRDLAEPIMTGNKPVILFAGEATHDHYYSTVHGGVETGFREADRLIDFERQLDSHL
ncbi:PREDICTED: spermine oxidase-like isoform X1 [Acromyrmex echinatior]|uniref:spermine oxidase-like isoform X1 n=1 Tax=Acromyrmex echinatior TaxID=103372 RepID=UPI000580C44C|nr:PREDICTED: spermine oxidase-like isoform X1 [Acromyrmex echinatior]